MLRNFFAIFVVDCAAAFFRNFLALLVVNRFAILLWDLVAFLVINSFAILLWNLLALLLVRGGALLIVLAIIPAHKKNKSKSGKEPKINTLASVVDNLPVVGLALLLGDVLALVVVQRLALLTVGRLTLRLDPGLARPHVVELAGQTLTSSSFG